MEIIHIVLGKGNPHRMNGVNKVVNQLATQQCLHGYRVSMWGFTKSEERNFEERNFKTVLFKSYKNPFLVDKAFIKMLDTCSTGTRFHIHGGWIPKFYTIARVLRKKGFSYILTPHGAYNEIAMQKNAILKTVYFGLFERKLVRNASYVHCIGQSEIDGLNNICKTDNTILQPYGFTMDMGVPKEMSKDAFIFGFLGRIDVYTKGLDLMLSAFSKMFRGNSMYTLWIIGDSKERAQLEKEVKKLGIVDQVVFWGAKFGEEKFNLLKKIDVFLHPSRNEGLPSAVLEAASLGVPSIVSKATNVGEYIVKHNAGYCVDNENVLSLSHAMNASCRLDKEMYHQQSMNAIQMVQNTFTWKRVIQDMENMYKA